MHFKKRRNVKNLKTDAMIQLMNLTKTNINIDSTVKSFLFICYLSKIKISKINYLTKKSK